ncbi:zinc finger transcription factor sma protein, putative (macronuclear) [Tetrahymena thermophila SB210]|uniref:non-specific serine/threonine protein kinase n=1 Tax=Tetrahymena thermophila (strain SB210) TaxID=312017 RepID=I7LT30_TETTS|nr:zinc finger transcription factor sma protein, putative [Tetrahymena thermophila SB210]EAR84143.2 zinc finger transcription factor sma protein, putative [Tetrahymena thermophila SB210]|eukprot:XP_001031806.2 zinc finger transcription factor sma protein, putative [Tetrahymena thermophila SB210]
MSLQNPDQDTLKQAEFRQSPTLVQNDQSNFKRQCSPSSGQFEESVVKEQKQQVQTSTIRNSQSPNRKQSQEKSKSNSRKQSIEDNNNNNHDVQVDKVLENQDEEVEDDYEEEDAVEEDDRNTLQKSIHNPEFLKQQQKKSDAFYAQLQKKYEEQKQLMETGLDQKQQETEKQNQNSTQQLYADNSEESKHNQQSILIQANSQLLDGRNIVSSVGMSNINQPLQDSSKWEWMTCNFLIKQIQAESTIVWSLQPTVTFGNPRNDQNIQVPKMSLIMERNFTYDSELGWNWHKSWILPTICLKLEIIDPETKEVFSPPKNTYAQIYAVKANTKEISKFHIIDVGLKGTDRLPLENGTVTFQALKFTSTSYNNEGSKFNLVVAIIVQNDNDPHPKVIEAMISPPVFVDSRKSARETQIIKHVKLSSFYDLFTPDNFQKHLIKRKKKENEPSQEEIQNDIGGFTGYFTAPNIRNKVKHPFFLAYKFSNCMQLYYNSDEFKGNLNYEKFVERVVESLLEKGRIHCSQNGKSKKVVNGIDKINQQALMTIVLTTQKQNIFFMNKKIAELLGPVDNSVVNIIFDKSYLPEKYVLIPNIEKIRKAYEDIYQKILKKQPLTKRSPSEEDMNYAKHEDITYKKLKIDEDDKMNSDESSPQPPQITQAQKLQFQMNSKPPDVVPKLQAYIAPQTKLQQASPQVKEEKSAKQPKQVNVATPALQEQSAIPQVKVQSSPGKNNIILQQQQQNQQQVLLQQQFDQNNLQQQQQQAQQKILIAGNSLAANQQQVPQQILPMHQQLVGNQINGLMQQQQLQQPIQQNQQLSQVQQQQQQQQQQQIIQQNMMIQQHQQQQPQQQHQNLSQQLLLVQDPQAFNLIQLQMLQQQAQPQQNQQLIGQIGNQAYTIPSTADINQIQLNQLLQQQQNQNLQMLNNQINQNAQNLIQLQNQPGSQIQVINGQIIPKQMEVQMGQFALQNQQGIGQINANQNIFVGQQMNQKQQQNLIQQQHQQQQARLIQQQQQQPFMTQQLVYNSQGILDPNYQLQLANQQIQSANQQIQQIQGIKTINQNDNALLLQQLGMQQQPQTQQQANGINQIFQQQAQPNRQIQQPQFNPAQQQQQQQYQMFNNMILNPNDPSSFKQINGNIQDFINNTQLQQIMGGKNTKIE